MKEFKGVRNKICTRIDTIDKLRRKSKGGKQTEVRAEQKLPTKILMNFSILV